MQRREHAWIGVALALGCIACSHESGGGDASGTGGSPACQVACDAGTSMHDAGMPDSGERDSGPPAPMGHPAPASSTGCAPEGPDTTALGAMRRVLYSGPRQLEQVASREQGVLVADRADGLLRMKPDTTTFERIAQVPMLASFLAADLSAYWLNGNTIYKASLDATDATPDMVATGVMHGAQFLTYDESNLYFADDGGGSIWKQPLDGSVPTSLDTAIALQDMKLFGGKLYYSDLYSQRVYRVPVDGGDAESLAVGTQGSVQAVAADSDWLYWVDDTQIERTPIGAPDEGTVIGQGGSAPLGRGRVLTMKLTEDRLYWADDVFNVGWTAIDGSACGLVVKGLPGLRGWDVGEKAVYVVVPGGGGSELWTIEKYLEP